MTDTTAPVTRIGTVTTLVNTQPDINTVNKANVINLFNGLCLKQ